MDYEPTVIAAIGAYMTAAADAYNVPIHAISNPGQSNVEEVSEGNFRIPNPQERDHMGRFNAPLAVCTYDDDTDLWTVELGTGETVQVRDVGNGFVTESN